MKTLSGVTYCFEEERKKPGKRRQRLKDFHFNGWPTSIEEKPPPPDVWQRTQGTLADAGDVESEWLETLLLPSQRCSLTNDESFRKLCHTPKRPRRERKVPVCLRDYVCTVAVYPGLLLNLRRKFKLKFISHYSS